MAATSQPISIARDHRAGGPSSHHALSPSTSHLQHSALHTSLHVPSPHHGQSSLLSQHAHLANPRWAGTSPRSAESSSSWAIHPGPLFVSAGSLGSTSGSFGAASMSGSAGSFRARMYPGCSPSAPLLNPLEPEFKFRGVAGSVESDHGSLINSHMSEREAEQFRNFTCCGLALNDLHALVEHFETHHVFVVDPLNPQPHPSMQLPINCSQNPLPNSNASENTTTARSTDSSLAGALGPSSFRSSHAPAPNGSEVDYPTGSAPSAFDLDDMELDMDMELEPPETQTQATSPAPSASSSSNNSNLSNSSARSSPLGGGAGPLPLTQPRRFFYNGMTNGTRSSVSSPPDTPLLTTPVSPFANAANVNSAFPWAAQAHDGLATPMGLASSHAQSMQSQNQGQVQQPAGPPAFDTVHLPPKHTHGGMFSHPYAGASSARRHPAHPLSPLSSAASPASTPGTMSPASASASGYGYPGGFPAGNSHGLHHTQSLYALRLARHTAGEREDAQLVARALNGYAGYEDYSRGFPGTGDSNGNDVGIAGGLSGGDGGLEMGGSGPTESAIHPGLLFGSTNANGGVNGNMNGATNVQVKNEPSSSTCLGLNTRRTPAPSRSGSGSPSSSNVASSSSTPAPSSAGPARKPPQPSTTLSRPSSSLLLSKPFKCPTPGCTKSYKQANGLKYHVTHGQCSFTPPPELSSISELGLSIGLNLKLGPMGIEGLENMSEKERRDAEREAERRLRPFCCQVKPCQRRYKNMNGLRYHYQHSGDHGAIGLRMLASGRHDATRSQSVDESDDERVQDDGSGKEGKGGERGRAKERVRKDGHGQTNSAPSTPGLRSQQPNSSSTQGSPFMTQAFAFQQHQLHQRSLSGSTASQPLSPLSQQFPPSSALSQPSSRSQSQFNSMNGTDGMNGGNQYAFAVQSQPASAYASPWGSRAGSPTSLTAPGQWGTPAQTAVGQSTGQDGMRS